MISLRYDAQTADGLLAANGEAGRAIGGRPTSLSIIYSYGDYRAATKVARSDDVGAKPIEITRESSGPANKGVASFSNPFGNLDAARTAPLRIEDALITPVPGTQNGWLVALTLYLFVAFYSVGPGVCVWLVFFVFMSIRFG